MDTVELLNNILGFIQMEYVIIIPTLLAFGITIKNTKRIADEYIPIVLMAVGVIFAIAVGQLTDEPMVHRVMQGVISSLASGWGYEAVKQIKKIKYDNTNTKERVIIIEEDDINE